MVPHLRRKSLTHVLSSPPGHGPLVPAMKQYQHALLLQCHHTHVIRIITDVKKEAGEACFIMAMNDSKRLDLPGGTLLKWVIQRCRASYAKKDLNLLRLMFNINHQTCMCYKNELKCCLTDIIKES